MPSYESPVLTLNGLLCYAYGLRDKGFKALNTLGCTSSIDHIRSHGAYWAQKRKAIEQLDPTCPWRLTIDNLNFYMKFAKNLPESANGSNKMLNLLTAQISHATHTPQPKNLTLKNLVFQAMSNFSNTTPRQQSSIEAVDFTLHNNTSESYYYQHFLAVCYACTMKRLTLPPTEQPCTLLQAIQGLMPNWTPSSKDNVVYGPVEEASSGSMSDIQAYLEKVKQDLQIGQSGNPVKIPVAGDQQTYALMKKLQKQHPEHYSWLLVLHGDWHMLQLLAEVIRDILWDGGFKQMCSQCGYKKMPTQWQEIHLLLLALYQSLLHKAVLVYIQHEPNGSYKKFWNWISKVGSVENKDETSKFWAVSFLF